MEEKEVVREGEAFERLLANEDFKVLQEYIQTQIQLYSGVILGPDKPVLVQGQMQPPIIEDFGDFKKHKGILLGLATPQSYMEDIVRQMKVIKEERRKAELEKKRLEEKRART